MDNWRDVYKEMDTNNDIVVDVWIRYGKAYCYVYRHSNSSIEYLSAGVAGLVKKPKPKKYRPFTIDEFREFRKNAGGVVWFRNKNSGREHLVTSIYKDKVIAGDGVCTFDWLIENMTFIDGSPAGMPEE